MGKNPAFQWYPNDYLRDTRILSLPSRGAWADMLNYMWYAEDRGVLIGTHDQFARMLSCSPEEIKQVINELSTTKIADVTNGNGIVTVINRRMYREERERKSTRFRVQKFRNAQSNATSNDDITPPSSTSSSTSIKNIYKGKFIKPSLEEIIIYCQERKNQINPQTFLDHYESNGWMVGKNKMKDWKAAIRTWERNNYGDQQGTGKLNTGKRFISGRTGLSQEAADHADNVTREYYAKVKATDSGTEKKT